MLTPALLLLPAASLQLNVAPVQGRRPGSTSAAVTYYPNGGSQRDTKNTVEQVVIEAPRAGYTYTVTVSGTDVVHGPQYYALVINGPFEGEVTKKTEGKSCCSEGRGEGEDQPVVVGDE